MIRKTYYYNYTGDNFFTNEIYMIIKNKMSLKTLNYKRAYFLKSSMTLTNLLKEEVVESRTTRSSNQK